MNPIVVFVSVLLTGVSGYHIRGGRALNSMDDGADVPPLETELSFDYDADAASATTAAPPAPESPLVGTTWTAVEISSMALLGEDHPVTISFDAYGIAGSAGCNRYRGGFNVLSDGSFRSSDDFATTKMYCHYPGAMEQERGFLTFMKSHEFWYGIDTSVGKGTKDELVLYDAASSIKGKVLARFVRDDGDAEGGRR
mmetsp:Transcript_11342/g.24565  ORF Transcript_11342/g.24565 Transcript_11342/m.24565 type:complete len:197 (-) Transcript_11342:246-836(-)